MSIHSLFRRLSLAAVLTVFMMGISSTAQANEPKTLMEALGLAAEQNRPLIIDFFSQW